MKKKLRSQKGLTLVEMLCAVVILTLLVLMLNTGLALALRSSRSVTAESETQLLLSTLSCALADDLRFAREIRTGEDGQLSSYSSDSYGVGASITLAENGQIYAGGKRMLPEAAYGSGYQVSALNITYTAESSCFHISLAVQTADGSVSSQADYDVQCLNKQNSN